MNYFLLKGARVQLCCFQPKIQTEMWKAALRHLCLGWDSCCFCLVIFVGPLIHRTGTSEWHCRWSVNGINVLVTYLVKHSPSTHQTHSSNDITVDTVTCLGQACFLHVKTDRMQVASWMPPWGLSTVWSQFLSLLTSSVLMNPNIPRPKTKRNLQ